MFQYPANLMYVTAFLSTFLCSTALVLTQRWHGRFSMDGTVGVQKLHAQPTPRIGGVAIALGLCAAWVASGSAVRSILGPLLLAGIPAFVFGLAEDIAKRVSVLTRLLATMGSGALAWYLTGVAMQNTGFPPLDWTLQWLPLAVLFTAFAIGGVTNAINIIDGFNGLASGSVAIMAAAIGVIALNVSDTGLAGTSFIVATCALGFGVVNWPLGKLFLGDGGAYLLGFALAWLAVLLPMRNPSLTAWTTIMVCAYPVLEVGFSVRRRRKREGHHPGQPDRAHLHHFIHRRLVRPSLRSAPAALQNGMTSPLCWVATALPAGIAVAFAGNTPALALGFGLAVFGYGAVYARLTQFRWCFSAATMSAQPANRPISESL
jgi:UDP-N-acetylmuramyl pentapeptide phosphotransferase/UDP-N-acetylglucosamine-1-phosphate transferase